MVRLLEEAIETGKRVAADLDQTHIPDPVAEQLRALDERIAALEQKRSRAPRTQSRSDS